MDEHVLRRSAEAFIRALQAGDLASVQRYLADGLRTRQFGVAGRIRSYQVVSVEPLGGEGEAVVRALCSGDQAELLESSWTELGGAPRRLSFGGPSATLETRWTQEHGLPGLTGLRVQGGPWFPP